MRYYIRVQGNVLVDRIVEYSVDASSKEQAMEMLEEDYDVFDGEIIDKFDVEDQSVIGDLQDKDIIKITHE